MSLGSATPRIVVYLVGSQQRGQVRIVCPDYSLMHLYVYFSLKGDAQYHTIFHSVLELMKNNGPACSKSHKYMALK